MKYHVYRLILVLLAPMLSLAQVPQDSLKQADSALLEIQALLLKSEQLRVRDSVRAAVLNDELSNIKHPEQAEQQALLAELELIRNQDSIRLMQQKQSIESLREKTKGAPVILFSDTLFTIYAPLGSFSAAQRAVDARDKIRALYENDLFDRDSLVITAQYGLLNIIYGKRTITSISTIDALWVNRDVDAMAADYHRIIGNSIVADQKIYSFRNITIRVGYAAVVVAGFLLMVWIINWLFRRLQHWLANRKAQILKGIKVKNYQLFTPEHMMSAVIQVLRILRFLVIIIALYLSLTLIFSIFPGTRNWTHTLLQWLWQPVRKIANAVFAYLPNLFTIIVILFVARFVARIFRFFSLEIERGILNLKGFHRDWAKPTYNIVRFFLYAFAFVIIFPYLPGSDSVAFKGVSVFLGILFSIGSSSAISNTIAGFVITYMRPFKVGDWIKVNEITGYVVEKTVLVTRLRTIHNEDITVPNSTILAHHTINYSSSGKDKGLIINTTVTIGYDVPWEKVKKLLLQSALQTTDIAADREPFVFHKALNDYYVSYEINASTHKPERMYYILSELHQHIQDNFTAAGVEIMSPQQIHIKP